MTRVADAWPRIGDIREKLEKRWRRGDLLRAWRNPGEGFPLTLPLRKPGAQQLSEQFEQVRAWVQHWQAEEQKGDFNLKWRDINHRQLGRNRLPDAVVFETPEQALKLIGRLSLAKTYDRLCQTLLAAFPELDPWCTDKPLTLLEKSEDWPRLQAVLAWMREHPRPKIHLRQLEIPGVHTKFIESNRRLLGELLDLILPADAINAASTGATGFNRRYGFLDKPLRVRFRLLDTTQCIADLDDLEIPVEDFNRLSLPIEKVFIVENEITAVAFPQITSALVLFGQGYRVEQLLRGADWLKQKQVFYWGDIDTHGFAILDRLRTVLPTARSLLMDRATLLRYRTLWVTEPEPVRRELRRLNPHEQSVYQELVENRLGKNVRLEQERISLSDLNC